MPQVTRSVVNPIGTAPNASSSVPGILPGILSRPTPDLSLGTGSVSKEEVSKARTGSLTCVCTHVPLQVEGVIEALAAEGAQVPLHLVVALEVAVEHALQAEALAAQVTVVNHRVAARAGGKLGAGREGA